MMWAFDLWAFEDVRARSRPILQMLEAGEMPCEDPWPPEAVEVFRRWVDAGAPR